MTKSDPAIGRPPSAFVVWAAVAQLAQRVRENALVSNAIRTEKPNYSAHKSAEATVRRGSERAPKDIAGSNSFFTLLMLGYGSPSLT
jgi:hypothetical protein